MIDAVKTLFALCDGHVRFGDSERKEVDILFNLTVWRMENQLELEYKYRHVYVSMAAV